MVHLAPKVGKDLDGYSSYESREIAVRTGQTGYLAFQTFIHELLHQLCVLHPIEDEERTVEALSHGLADLLIGNAEEWSKLLKDLQKKGNRNGIVRER